MRTSAFAPKKDDRTVHQRFCDYEVAKASKPKFHGGMRPLGKAPSGVKFNEYTTQELKNLLTQMF